ncbi:MAG: hypothetical protein ACPL3C_12420, partial [Pyrobaculum sp.]
YIELCSGWGGGCGAQCEDKAPVVVTYSPAEDPRGGWLWSAARVPHLALSLSAAEGRSPLT